MEKEKHFFTEDNPMAPTWNSTKFGMEIQHNELNYGYFNPNWENSMGQSDPFESALSSMVSSPAASNAAAGDGVVLRELIGRLGSICNSGEISPPQSYIGNNSTNTSCYNTPLNSPPKLNLSIMDHQIRGNFPIPGNQLPFSADPGFAERAARFSSFSSRNFGGLNGQFGVSESEFPHRLGPTRVETGNLSRVASNQTVNVAAGLPVDVQENKDFPSKDGNSAKFSRLSRSSTPEKAEFGDSREESSVSEQIPGGETGPKSQSDANARKRKSIPRAKAKENAPSSSSPAAKDSKVAAESDESNTKRNKQGESTANEKNTGKAKGNENGNEKQTKENAKPPEPPKDYIHVRARRGQATDSHSLAERVRREKISERMKFLQDLVPGCNKVTGKAVMLDEIINYVQSLQRQVEFLSMKLSTVNPRMDFSMETLLSKDIFQSRGGSVPSNSIYPLETASTAFPYGFQSPHGANMPNGTETPFSMNPLSNSLRRNPSAQMPPIDGFGEAAAASQASTFWEDDLQSVVQMGFGQNQPQNFQSTAQMKVEQ